jgi:hypothetical protein
LSDQLDVEEWQTGKAFRLSRCGGRNPWADRPNVIRVDDVAAKPLFKTIRRTPA